MESKIHEKLVFIWSPFFSSFGPGRIGKSLLKGSELKAKSCSGSPDKTPQELWNCPKCLKCLPLKFPILTDLSKYVRIWLKFHKFFDQWKDVVVLKGKPHWRSLAANLGIARLGRGVLTLARMVWGTYLEKNCLSSNGHFLDCGGVTMLWTSEHYTGSTSLRVCLQGSSIA